MAMEIKAPGVFVQEIKGGPTPIVGVETAIPAFIGYTETAEDDGRPLHLVPTLIGSPADYTRIFGGGAKTLFKLEQDIEAGADFMSAGRSYAVIPEAKFNLSDSVRLFYANGGGRCYIVSAGSYGDDLGQRASALQAGLAAVHDLVGPTMLVIPEATLLDLQDYGVLRQAMLAQCADRQDRVAILDVVGTDRSFPAADAQAAKAYFHDRVDDFRAGLNVLENLKFGMAYAPFLKTSVVDAGEFSFDNFDSASTQMITAVIEAEIDLLYPAPDPQGSNLRADLLDIWSADPSARAALGRKLTSQIPMLQQIFAAMAARRGTLPPSAAMAGVYTRNDLVHGVWHAPANAALVAVTGPTLPVDSAMLKYLDTPLDGLAVNAIRVPFGAETVVWGARTLDGNSSDWRYIPVRRATIYIGQSIKAALARFVFEPNAAPAWAAVTAMMNTFLLDLWKQGALIGTRPQDAFWAKCGLGSTMTAQDLLDGRLIVEIGMAPVRPAEFIVLRFAQQMRGE